MLTHAGRPDEKIHEFALREILLIVQEDPITQGRVMTALRAPGPYRNQGLADDMERALAGN